MSWGSSPCLREYYSGQETVEMYPLPNQSDNRTVDRAIDTSQWDRIHVTSSLGSNRRPGRRLINARIPEFHQQPVPVSKLSRWELTARSFGNVGESREFGSRVPRGAGGAEDEAETILTISRQGNGMEEGWARLRVHPKVRIEKRAVFEATKRSAGNRIGCRVIDRQIEDRQTGRNKADERWYPSRPCSVLNSGL